MVIRINSDEMLTRAWENLRYAAVIGDPVRYSCPPVIHNEWCRRARVNGLYIPVKVSDDVESFTRAIDGMKAGGFAGANVTMPHKARALAIADSQSETAVEINAANMLTFTDGLSAADNSDRYGFSEALKNALPAETDQPPNIKSATVLGAGGSAGAICLA